ncbi:LysR family transcriptional regulator [Asaia sp. As-1742]|nr:LysR family transcriptional regulator [Asaia sp. As-1742]
MLDLCGSDIRKDHQVMKMDLNLLVALDALLSECSVVKAAGRLGLSSSAMSRTLMRLRESTGDPLLVRGGRGLVPTPHALALGESVREVAMQAQALLSPVQASFTPRTLERQFTLRTNEGFIEACATRLVQVFLSEAPGVSLVFLPRRSKEATSMREGTVDLEVGVIGPGDFGPEMRMKTLFHDRFYGVAARTHSLFDGPVTAGRYAQCHHVVASRHGSAAGPVDRALAQQVLTRTVKVVVPAFDDALRLASATNLVALVPGSSIRADQSLRVFDLPFEAPAITISALWHPRLSADPAHRWFRERLIALCRQQLPIIPQGMMPEGV